MPDISERWARLKDLLRDDPEFEARYPVAYELLFEQEATWGVYLPSFGVRVLGNSHQPIAICKRELKGVEHEGGFADAYSLQHDGVFGHVGTDPRWPHSLSVPAPPHREEEEIEVTGRFPPMYGQAWFSPMTEVDMQGVLLAIMGRDELSARGIGIGSLTDRAVYECPPVRITDLRLAVDLFDDAGSGQRNLLGMLRPIIETLPKPMSPEAVIRWKRERLETLAGESGGGSVTRPWSEIKAVTFVTAAVCLFLDLGGPVLDLNKPLGLTANVVSLADEIRKITDRLNGSAARLAKMVADRTEGRPKRSDFECLFALSCYRMGYDMRLIAERNDIRPFDVNEARGTKSWRKKVINIVVRGVNVEKRLYPRAASIFDEEDDPEVLAKAEKAYLAFVWALPPNALAKAGEAVGINAATDLGNEIVPAYVQLGSCKYHGIPCRPKHHD